MSNIEIAEDLASETFLSALETWPYKGLPQNPTAWLYLVARNKAKNYMRRSHLFTGRITGDLTAGMPGHIAGRTGYDPAGTNGVNELEIDLSEPNISDSQLQMLFAVCHPSISTEAQIALALRVLCGFGIVEIANAFLTNKEIINKRLFRAREKLRQEKVQLEFPDGDEINNRLDTVLLTLYLLFNEGYYSESRDAVLREDLCLEAMRLTYLLIENPATNRPGVNALFSLMCFHASRFGARKTENGELILYQDQDETLWNQELIAKGVYFLHEASVGNHLSRYHLEAMIAYWNTQKADTKEKWENILQLYNRLLQIEYSPIAALNRTYALFRANGRESAIAEAEKLDLKDSPFYFALLGELYTGVDNDRAKRHFQKACSLAKTNADKRAIEKKLENL